MCALVSQILSCMMDEKGGIAMTIHDVPVSALVPYENNPRINDQAVDKVAESIREFGFKVPVVVDKNNVIVAGHTRVKAAEQIGLDTVPVIVADDLNDEQIQAFRLADNKTAEFSKWDMEKLEQELSELDVDMSRYGFSNIDIDWESVDDLSDESYDEPKKEMLECPFCHRKDVKIHFKAVE